MGAGAQLRPGRRGDRRAGRILTYGPAPLEPRIGRVALIVLVPALLLPVIAGIVILIRLTVGTGSDDGVGGLIVLAYLFVLLGSMTLNAWLLLRHPDTVRKRALPWGPSVVLVALWAVVGLWAILLGVPVPGDIRAWISIVLSILGIVLSVVSFLLAAARRSTTANCSPLAEVRLGTQAQVILWIYLVGSGLALLSYVAVTVLGSNSVAGSGLGGPPSWVLLVLGLPWSHPLYFLSLVGGVMLTTALGSASAVAAVVVPVIGVGVNIALACVILFSPTRRTRLANWFFRLRSTTAETPAPEPPQ